MFSSRDQPQDRGARSSQPRMAPTVVGRSKSQRRDSVGGNEAHEAADKGKVVEYKTKETGSLDQAIPMSFYDRNGVHSKHDAIHSFTGKLKKQCIASRDRCESCEAGCSVQETSSTTEGLCSEGTAELAEKAFENQAEVKAEIHVEEAKAAE